MLSKSWIHAKDKINNSFISVMRGFNLPKGRGCGGGGVWGLGVEWIFMQPWFITGKQKYRKAMDSHIVLPKICIKLKKLWLYITPHSKIKQNGTPHPKKTPNKHKQKSRNTRKKNRLNACV